MSGDYRPGRPFGVSVAVIVSVVFFTILPLAELLAVLFISRTVLNEGFSGFAGISIAGLSDPLLIAQAAIALLFLMIAVMTWRGKPASIRIVFWITVLVFSGGLFSIQIITALSSVPDLSSGFDSATQYETPLQFAYLITLALIGLYTTWFMNRWSARAFYRGYYLPADLKRIEDARI